MSESEDDSSQTYPLHECIFEGDLKSFSQLLRTHDVAKKDKHGELKVISIDTVNFYQIFYQNITINGAWIFTFDLYLFRKIFRQTLFFLHPIDNKVIK